MSAHGIDRLVRAAFPPFVRFRQQGREPSQTYGRQARRDVDPAVDRQQTWSKRRRSCRDRFITNALTLRVPLSSAPKSVADPGGEPDYLLTGEPSFDRLRLHGFNCVPIDIEEVVVDSLAKECPWILEASFSGARKVCLDQHLAAEVRCVCGNGREAHEVPMEIDRHPRPRFVWGVNSFCET